MKTIYEAVPAGAFSGPGSVRDTGCVGRGTSLADCVVKILRQVKKHNENLSG
jgi:hypothetical protein